MLFRTLLFFPILSIALSRLVGLQGDRDRRDRDRDGEDDRGRNRDKGEKKDHEDYNHHDDEFEHERIYAQSGTNLQPQQTASSGVFMLLPDVSPFSPAKKNVTKTKPAPMFGNGSPSNYSTNFPEATGAFISQIKTEAFTGSLFANYKASDTAGANAGGYSMPPDNVLCAGNNQVVLMVNSAVAVYSTVTGARLKMVSLTALFGNNKRGSFFDPRCVYDSINSRFVMISDYVETNAAGNIVTSGIFIMATRTADATGLYYYYYFELKNLCANGQCFVDFPTMGIDKYGIWLATNNFVNKGGFAGSAIIAFNKAVLYSGGVLSYCYWNNVKYGVNNIFTIQPAIVPPGATPVDGTQYFIANYGSTSVYKATVTGTANIATCASMSLTSTLVTGLQSMSTPRSSIPQSNGVTVAGDDGRMTQLILSGPNSNTLFFARAVATVGTTTGMAVFAINRATNAIQRQGVLAFANWNIINGAMVADVNGNAVIVSTVIPPAATSSITQMYTAFSIAAGFGASLYRPNTFHLCGFTTPKRTGDYSGAALNSDGIAYVASMTASSDVCPGRPTNWMASITKVTLV